MGIEALSRGAAQAVLVDASREAVQAMRANLAYTGLLERAEVMPMDYARALARLYTPFDFIFLGRRIGRICMRRQSRAFMRAVCWRRRGFLSWNTTGSFRWKGRRF